MIERKFVAQNFKEFQIKNYVKQMLNKVGLSGVKLQRTSLGERVIIKASRPGLVVGRGGSTIQKLTSDLKTKFKLENPQIEIEEVTNFNLDATVVAETIVAQLERFGTQRFKGIGHKSMEGVMRAGALGVEILSSGKIPSSRAKTWRFADGYMKKCGDIAISGVDTAKEFANLKTGIVGIQVRIMPATTILPDQISFNKREKVAEELAQQEARELQKQERKAKTAMKIKGDETDSEEESKNSEEKQKKKTTKKTTKKTPKKDSSSKKQSKTEESKQ
jgi:small subunit ribosomal protein S3